MTAIRVTESSGSVGILQISDGTGGFSPSNILYHTASSGIAKSILLGKDVAVFVSGAVDSKDTTNAGVAVFGGDVTISGTLYGGSPLKLGGEVEFITSDGGTTDLKNPSGSVKIFARDEVKIGSDDGLIRLIDLGGSSAGKIFLTGSNTTTDRRLKFLSKGQIHFHGSNPNAESPGSNVFLFVSGAIDSHKTLKRGTALFGGDVVISGTLYAEKQVVEVDEVATGHLMVSGTIYGTGTIGPAEDGAYTDGLFTDFTNSTHVGTAVDRFNEILKALSPSPAPSLDDVDNNNSGASGKLSFGSSNSVSGYTNSNTTAGFSAVDVDGTYSSTTSGNNVRIGLLGGSTAVTGDLNEDVSADTHASNQTNYVANSFGDADSGTLKLYVNGSLVHSVVITGSDGGGHVGAGVPGSGTGSSVNSNGSGFTNLSATGSAVFSDGTELDLFQHRTGRYSIAASDQRSGWNYARVVHSLDSGDVTTNYVEWINDADSNALAAAGAAFDTLSMTGDLRISGVRYHTAGSAQYRVRVTNAYKNVYTTSNITFTETNCTISNQSMPSAGNDEDKILHLTGSATISASALLNGSISASVNVSHPLKSNISGGGSQSISGILMWAYSNSSTVLQETFRRENYRIISGTYANQASITHSDNTWDGSIHMSGSGAHANGLMFYNQRLYAPKQGANSSNFGGISNGPSDNVNYSGISSGLRTFYRYFQNNSGGSKTGFSLAINGSGTIVSSDTALNASRIRVFVKLPTTGGSQSTGWMDLAEAFSTGQVGDNNGCLEGSLDSSLNATNTVTFGTQFVADDEYITIRVEADASFTGYVSQITVSWS